MGSTSESTMAWSVVNYLMEMDLISFNVSHSTIKEYIKLFLNQDKCDLDQDQSDLNDQDQHDLDQDQFNLNDQDQHDLDQDQFDLNDQDQFDLNDQDQFDLNNQDQNDYNHDQDQFDLHDQDQNDQYGQYNYDQQHDQYNQDQHELDQDQYSFSVIKSLSYIDSPPCFNHSLTNQSPPAVAHKSPPIIINDSPVINGEPDLIFNDKNLLINHTEITTPLTDNMTLPPSCKFKTPPKVTVVLESDEEEMEQLFKSLRLDTEKKNEKRKKLLRESMSAFIVSDSEEIEEEEDHYRPLPMIALDSPVSDREMKRRKKIMTPTYMCSPPSVGYHNKDCFKTPSLPLPPMTPSSCKSVSRNRKAMAAELFQLFNETVFDNKLPHDMEICWNKRLRTTAGCCINSGTTIVPMCKIELSNKVCDSYERIQDTLIHELCHAATWMIDKVKDAGHGPVWKKWTERAMFAHSGLNPITTKHNYEISYKFTYKCTKCDYKIGRHSKSVNLLVAKCPLCLGSLVLV